MKKLFKWIGMIFGSLLGLLVLASTVLWMRGNSLINKSYDIAVEPIAVPTDIASIEKGEHLAAVLCSGCHGANLGGIPGWFSSPPLGKIDSANLTSGQGGIGSKYQSVEDYVRAIRHGVDPEGKAIYMTAVLALNHMSDEDLGAVIAYLKTLPAVDQVARGNEQLTPLAIILVGAGQFPMQAELVDHTNLHPVAPPEAVSADYGKYLATLNHCNECHGENLAGGRYPDPSLTVFGPNLTPGGELANWTEGDFIIAMRTGNTPEGTKMKGYMPWPFIGQMTDEELTAIWRYLQSLPAAP